MNDIRVSLFQNPKAYSSALVPMDEILRLIQYDTDIDQKTQLYRERAANMGRQTANDTVKQKLMPTFSVAVTFRGLGHSREQAAAWTGLAMCDIDKIESDEVLEAAFARLAADPHTLLIYRTISGCGLRILYRYLRENGQRIDDTSWRAAFYMGNEYLSAIAGLPFDEGCSDFTRLSGLAHDVRLYYNADAKPLTVPDDLIVSHNCEYQEHGRPRKEYAAGSFHPSPEEAWPRVEQILTEKQVAYAPGHHHDYVLHASYLFNRFGVPLDELLQWASHEWADYDGREREDAIRHKYKDEARHGCWKLSGRKKGRENAMITLPEIRQWLTEHLHVCYNLVTSQLLYREIRTSDSRSQTGELLLSDTDWQQVDAFFYNTQRGRLAEDTGKRVLTSDVKSVVESDFARQLHPIREYVSGLPQWDGTDRVAELASHVRVKASSERQTDETAQQSFLWALHKWLVAMVATWMNDSVANHEILTLIGPQGIYKTTFFRHLLPPPLHGYFWENAHNSFHQKDDKIALAENCLVEIEEVDAIEGRDMAELKGLVTSLYVKERRPYAEFREQKTRLASFCASGNEQHILTDKTGNRRWLCFLVDAIDDPRQWQLDYEQLYAQLRDEYAGGFQYWFDKPDEDRVCLLNQPFCLASTEEQLITTRLRKPRGNESFKLMNATMIAMYLSGGHLSPSISVRKVGDVMHSLGYRFQHRNSGNFYKVVEIPFTEQQTYIELGDAIESQESESSQPPDPEQLDLPF